MTVAAPAGRADRQHRHIGVRHGVSGVDGEGETPGGNIGGDQCLQTRLVDRNLPGPERRDPFGLGIDAGHAMAELREARGRHQAHITGTDHCNTHRDVPR